MFFPEFELDGIGVVLVNVKDNELLRLMRGDLTTQLRPDASAAARDHDHLAMDIVENLRQISAYRFTPQKILNGDVLHGADTHAPHGKLGHAGNLLERAAGLAADAEDFLLILSRGV